MKKDKLLQAVKQAILQQAIQGKLTEDWRKQNLDTESASELLKHIKVKKEKLIAEKKIRKEKPLLPITEEEIPFELPDSWMWCRLGEIYQSTSGGTPTRGNHEYWNGNIYWYKSGELNDGILENPSKEFITAKGLKESSATLFPKGTLLIAMYGATAGKLAVLNVEATTNQAVCGFYKNEKVSTEYLFNYLLANRNKMIKESWGMSQPNISQTYLRNFVFALPPLAEQEAIVEKVEKLMQQAEAISQGAYFKDFEIINTKAHQLLKNYYFIKNMLNEISTQKQNITQLKQSILQEAIQGKLTEDWRKQNLDTESASELLNRIKAEKEKLIKEKKIRKQKPLSPITKEEIPFELPNGWMWCRFKEIVNFQLGKTPASKEAGYWINGTIDWLNISDMVNGGFINKTSKKITEKAVKDVFKTQKIVPVNTLLMSFKLTVGKVSINKIPLFHNEAIISIFPYKGISQIFLFNILPVVTDLSASKKVLMGQTFNSTSLANMIFPLPQLAEQEAIVEKVENLMQKVSAMEEEINKSEQNAQMLMQAELKEAFDGKKEEVEV